VYQCAFFCTLLLLPVLALSQEPENNARPNTRQRGQTIREFLGLGPPPDPAAAKKGEPLFKQNCSGCHGEDARGAQGPNLVRSVLVLHDENDEAIGPVIKNGRPQGGMPAFPQLSQEEIHDISQYIKMQIELAANRGTYGKQYGNQRGHTSGDPQKGKEFFEANCASCHSASGDLAKIGDKFPDASAMQARFLWPASRGPVHATVVTRSGQELNGTLVKFDDFDVELTDGEGAYHYWPRDQVTVKMDNKLQGHRELLPKYTDADIHNVTAYLETLR
jgi:cytochrome c oxidase cbb3-type subunit 3